MNLERESRHSDYGDDAGGYSVLRFNGEWIGRVDNREAADSLIAYVKSLVDELARLQWKPITPENLPKVGDEIMMSQRPEMIYAVDRFASKYTYDVWKRYGWAHFRPSNPPLTDKEGGRG